MHFVTGGAFHGKKKWVIEAYQLNKSNCYWFNGYQESRNYCDLLTNINRDIVVIEGIEQVITEIIKTETIPVHATFQIWLLQLLNWEQSSPERKIIMIGTDIGKGVVPIEKEQRLIRDEVGRCFQELSQQATQVSLIWYGLRQLLKN